MGDGVTTIGSRAFRYCDKLTSVELPTGITSIGVSAFESCTGLTTVELPVGVTSIGEYAFTGCKNLTALELPAGVASVGEGAFKGCTALTSVEMSAGLTTIGDEAFAGCTVLAAVEIPEGVTTIGNEAFLGCAALTAVEIPEGVTTLENSVFGDCTALASVKIPAGVTSIGGSAFYGCTALTTVELPEGVTSIGSSAFYGCRGLTSMEIPEGVTSIGSYAFSYCSGLESIDVPDSVQTLGTGVFQYCSSMTRARVGDGVSDILQGMFAGCSSLEEVDLPFAEGYKTGVWKYSFGAIFGGNAYTGGVATAQKYLDYYGSGTWVDATYYVPATLKRVTIRGGEPHEYTFVNCGGLTSITIGDGVTSIGYGAFSGCSGLEEIDLPFVGLDKNVVDLFPFGAIFGGNDYAGGVATEQKYLPSVANYFSEATYYVPATLKRVTIRGGKIYEYAFVNCTGLTSVELPAGITSISEYAFSGCASLVSIEIPAGVTGIGQNAFYGCESLTSVTIPTSLSTVGLRAFLGCYGLREVRISDLAAWCAIQFSDEYGNPLSVSRGGVELYLKDEPLGGVLIIPNGVTAIGKYAFSGYQLLHTVTIPAGVTAIGDRAFWNTRDLLWAEFLGDAPANVGSNVFVSNYSSSKYFTIYYHQGKTGWTDPMWGQYSCVCWDIPEDLSTLDENDRNNQGILFVLNASGTATVGDNTGTYNNSGYRGVGWGRVVIPDTVTKGEKSYRVIGVGQNAFSGNKQVRTVSLGRYVSSVDQTAFVGCPELTAFTVSEESVTYQAVDGVLYDAVQLCLYCYPAGKPETEFTVPETVKTIGGNAFYEAAALERVTLSERVTALGDGAFYGCTALEEMVIPEGVKTIRNSTFSGCGSLTRVTIPSTVQKVEYFAFDLCYGLTGVYITDLGAWCGISFADYSCNPLFFAHNLYLNDELLTHAVISGDVAGLNRYVFHGCTSLTELTLEDGVKWIELYALLGCENLRQVNIGATLNSLSIREVMNESIQRYQVSENNPYWSTDKWGVLYNKDKSTLVRYPSGRVWPYYNVPGNTTRIQESAFENCACLVNLYIPTTVTNLESRAIRYCPGTTVCVYEDSAADSYATGNGLNVWYMDNYTIQGIEIYSLPEDDVMEEDEEEPQGLYVVANYGGRQLQLDEYTITYTERRHGACTARVEHQGLTASFEVLRYNGESQMALEFGAVPAALEPGAQVLVAVFENGQLVAIQDAATDNGRVKTAVDKDEWAGLEDVRLFCLDGTTWAPLCETVGPLP